jgi:tetratricopeptide (TPR) repeat protein
MTLGRWMGETRRPWREALAMFCQAGRGLAAAHRAGLVHRDFKPENVLVGKDGIARVTDFGLARPTGPAEPPSGPISLPLGETALDTPLTRLGVVVGTPAYMAPEQRRGEASDARTDQFSFCVALHEALFGERPFDLDLPGDDPRRWQARPAPAGSGIPAWLRRVVARGLAEKPADRWPSMEALLDALSKDPARARRRLAGVALAALAVVAVGVVAMRAGDRASLCKGAEAKLTGAWDLTRKAAVRTAFLATGRPQAAEAFATVERALDAYAGDWVAMRGEACEATRVKGEQSEQVMQLRMACLDARLRDVTALSGVLAKADAEIVDRGASSAFALPSLSPCADAKALLAPVSPPDDPAIRARVDALGGELAAARALREAGKYREAVLAALAVAGRAKEAGYAPFAASALSELGASQEMAGDYPAAEKSLQEGLFAAEAGRDDAEIARAWTALVSIIGYQQARPEEGIQLSRHAEAAIARLGRPDELQIRLETNLGLVRMLQGKSDEAVAHLGRAVEQAQRVWPNGHIFVMHAHQNYGLALFDAGRLEEALAEHRKVEELATRTFGPIHPIVSMGLGGEGNALQALGRFTEAEVVYRRSLELDRKLLGPDHRHTAASVFNHARTLSLLGRYDEALREDAEALRIYEKALGPDHPDVALPLENMGNVYRDTERYDEAAKYHRRALAVIEKKLGAQSGEYASTLSELAIDLSGARKFREAVETFKRAIAIGEKTMGVSAGDVGPMCTNLGDALQFWGRAAESLPWYRRAMEIEETVFGKEHFLLGYALTGYGDSLLELGKLDLALAAQERALAIREKQGDKVDIATTRFALARVKWAKKERDPAMAAAKQAGLGFAAEGARGERGRREVDAWIAKRQPRG